MPGSPATIPAVSEVPATGLIASLINRSVMSFPPGESLTAARRQQAGNPGYTITTQGKPAEFTITIKAPTQTMIYKGGVSGSKMTGTFHVDTINAGSGDGTFDCTEDPSRS